MESELHSGIARVSENIVALRVLDTLMGLLGEILERALQAPGAPQKSSAAHRRILVACTRGFH